MLVGSVGELLKSARKNYLLCKRCEKRVSVATLYIGLVL